MSRIRLNHPIFKQISASTFSFLIERSFLFKLMTNFGAYQEGLRAMNNIYFVLYGELHLSKKGAGDFGDPLVMGYTLGEEILFSERQPVYRMESCIASAGEGTALLQVSVEEFIKMGTSRQLRISRGASLVKDFKVLMGILQDNYNLKQGWRQELDL